MRTVEDILAKERVVVKAAEEVLKTDVYYQNSKYNEGKVSYKYGRITMALAIEITDLKRKIERLKKENELLNKLRDYDSNN